MCFIAVLIHFQKKEAPSAFRKCNRNGKWLCFWLQFHRLISNRFIPTEWVPKCENWTQSNILSKRHFQFSFIKYFSNILHHDFVHNILCKCSFCSHTWNALLLIAILLNNESGVFTHMYRVSFTHNLSIKHTHEINKWQTLYFTEHLLENCICSWYMMNLHYVRVCAI